MSNKVKIYFNEKEHKYTDDRGNTYTSTTTYLSKYYPKFDTEGEALRCSRKYKARKGHRYYGMTPSDIKNYWKKLTDTSLDRGNERHNYLEDTVKRVTGYNKIEGRFINDRIYTIDDILENHTYGLVDISMYEKAGLKDRYPEIYNVILYHHERGYRLYAEIGVYMYDRLISGLVDLLVVKGKEFRVLDWKTNKDNIQFKSGYYKRDHSGKDLRIWVDQTKYMYPPISHLPECNGTKYALQLSTYAHLIELRGYKCTGIYLCHIQPEMDDLNRIIPNGNEKVNWINMTPYYYKREVDVLTADYFRTRTDITAQTKLYQL